MLCNSLVHQTRIWPKYITIGNFAQNIGRSSPPLQPAPTGISCHNRLMDLLLTQGPADVFQRMVLPLLTIQGIAKLDSAVVNAKSRKGFLEILSGYVFTCEIKLTVEAAQWLLSRKCHATALRVNREIIAEYPACLAELSLRVQTLGFCGYQWLQSDIVTILMHFEHIETLIMPYVHNTDAVVASITEICSRLQRVVMSECHVSSSDVEALVSGCKNLHYMDMRWSRRITDRALYAIARHCSQLSLISVNCGSRISDSAIIALVEQCRFLKELTLVRGELVTDAAVLATALNCRQLAVLGLFSCTNITDASIAVIAERCIHLDVLNLHGSHAVTDISLAAIAQHCTRLTELHLYNCRAVTDVGVVAVAQRCTNMLTICLPACVSITDGAVVAIAHNCPALTELDLSNCNNVTDAAIVEVARHCVNLQRLNVLLCMQVIAVSIIALAEHCHQLRTVEVSVNESMHTPECKAALQQLKVRIKG